MPDVITILLLAQQLMSHDHCEQKLFSYLACIDKQVLIQNLQTDGIVCPEITARNFAQRSIWLTQPTKHSQINTFYVWKYQFLNDKYFSITIQSQEKIGRFNFSIKVSIICSYMGHQSRAPDPLSLLLVQFLQANAQSGGWFCWACPGRQVFIQNVLLDGTVCPQTTSKYFVYRISLQPNLQILNQIKYFLFIKTTVFE